MSNHKIQIDEVWPVSTKVYPNGGIGVSWSGDIGFGEWSLWWGKDGKLHADTERLDNDESKKFTRTIFELLIDQIEVDG